MSNDYIIKELEDELTEANITIDELKVEIGHMAQENQQLKQEIEELKSSS